MPAHEDPSIGSFDPRPRRKPSGVRRSAPALGGTFGPWRRGALRAAWDEAWGERAMPATRRQPSGARTKDEDTHE